MSGASFGILDLDPEHVTEPPEFTEPDTITAMLNLDVVPDDLVPRTIEMLDGALQAQIANELERTRIQTIANVIGERNRILAQPPRAVNFPKQSTAARRERKEAGGRGGGASGFQTRTTRSTSKRWQVAAGAW